MKIRNGFVSNSSSSSFIIINKKGGELSKDKLMEIMDVHINSPMYIFAKEIVDVIYNSCSSSKTLEDFKNEYYGSYGTMEDFREEEPDMVKMFEECLEKGWSYHHGSVSDEEGGMESALCSMNIDFEDDNIKIEKDGGY